MPFRLSFIILESWVIFVVMSPDEFSRLGLGFMNGFQECEYVQRG